MTGIRVIDYSPALRPGQASGKVQFLRVRDLLNRPLRNLRLSVTDRCNLRCGYCMPEADYTWLPREHLLSFEEIDAIVDAFLALGVTRIRLTGGEPLLRRRLTALVARLARKPGLEDLALTTNGLLLADEVHGLKAAGLGRVTVSLDTLKRDRFEALTRFDALDRVTAGIEQACRVFGGLKIDAVVIRGFNDDELVDLVEYGKRADAEVRFIEYMDVGGATRWSPGQVFPRNEILARVGARYGRIEPVIETSSAPAERFRLPDGTVFGVIASTTSPFCRSCDRSRLTADGLWYLCLYATAGVDLRAALRSGAPRADLEAMIAEAWSRRDDRGAERQILLGEGRGFVSVDALRQDPHLEMHTRGG
jgi:cyclic pyranopterin phosphate synthase